MDRKPVVSGKFYPGTPVQLQRNCEALIGIEEQAQGKRYFERPYGAILPHAGYIYSGKTAGMALKELVRYGCPRYVIILGPNHTGYGKSVSVWPEGYWHVPNGSVKVSEEIVEMIVDDQIIFKDMDAHLFEHSIEVQLPLLIAAFGEFELVPICMLDQRLSTALKVAEKIKKVLEKYPETLVVASSDFNHYDPHEVTLDKDEKVIKYVLSGELEEMYKAISQYDVSMCGPGPVAVVRSLFENVKLIYHTTSAEFSQDYLYTVGYASFVLS
ncbi:AmmeMemoRadiSam system protein B [Fervidobacterium thailandense]|uniref:MEMO1 family protein A4H02_07245 n=1 Tax=Fervidobacterium thailandense TaxID=1008305 RepID=A0A1E3G1G3_9BACT|nr:AmmeMemoRadiSam system protein B [Fervidobacterium thailandense]ODN30091.1 extradiol dioxygenase [Fervidobacterium thailandense]